MPTELMGFTLYQPAHAKVSHKLNAVWVQRSAAMVKCHISIRKTVQSALVFVMSVCLVFSML
jgi:hypothetical protein